MFVWGVVAVLFIAFAFGYATVTTHVSKPALEALISFSFDGVEKGVDPNGDNFEVTTVKSPAVIEAALTDLGMDLTNLEPIRAGIKFKGIVPKDAVNRITMYEQVVDKTGNVNAVENILDPSLTVLTQEMKFCIALLEMDGRAHIGLGKMTVHNQKI